MRSQYLRQERQLAEIDDSSWSSNHNEQQLTSALSTIFVVVSPCSPCVRRPRPVLLLRWQTPECWCCKLVLLNHTQQTISPITASHSHYQCHQHYISSSSHCSLSKTWTHKIRKTKCSEGHLLLPQKSYYSYCKSMTYAINTINMRLLNKVFSTTSLCLLKGFAHKTDISQINLHNFWSQ